MDIRSFIDWVNEDPKNRVVEIKIGSRDRYVYPHKVEVRAFVYDFGLGVGQYVGSVAEVDLKAKAEEEERREYERLKRKFEKAHVRSA